MERQLAHLGDVATAFPVLANALSGTHLPRGTDAQFAAQVAVSTIRVRTGPRR
jgi:hypothetical protein